MTQFWNLFKIELQSKTDLFRTKTKKQLFVLIFSVILKSALLVGLSLLLSYYLIQVALSNNIANEFLILFLLVIMVVIFFLSLNQMVKNLENENQNKEILLFPIGGAKIFFSKFLVLYLNILWNMILFVLPFMILWGLQTLQGAVFYGFLPFTLLLTPIIPLFFALLFLIPVLKIYYFLKNKFILNFLAVGFLILLGFLLYTYVLQVVVTVFSSQASSTLSSDVIIAIQSFSAKLFLPVLLKNILINSNLLKSLFIFLTLNFVCALGIVFFAKKIFYKILRKSVLFENTFGRKKTKLKKQSLLMTFFKKDFLTTFRNSGYSFSFFTMGLLCPIFVLLCFKILSDFNFPSNLHFAFALVLILVFMSLMISFTATTITREGKNFNITKVIPIQIKKQIKIKIAFYMIFIAVFTFISALLLAVCGYISYIDLGILFAGCCMIMYSQVCMSINYDIKSPKFKDLFNNSMVKYNQNISKSFSIGFLNAVFIGFTAIIICMFTLKEYAYIPVLILPTIYILISHHRLFHNIEKKYDNISV